MALCGCRRDEDEIKFKVTGTANDYDVTLKIGNSTTLEYTGVSSEWSYAFNKDDNESVFVSILAKSNETSGSVIVDILLNGSTSLTDDNSGDNVEAYAEGYLE